MLQMKKLIVFTIDAKYIEPYVVAIESFTKFHDPKKYEIGLVYSNISEQDIIKIKKYMNNKNISFQIKKIEDNFKDIQVSYHFNSVIFYRLSLAKIFCDYEKLLYLDSDILFMDNIDELFNIDLENKILAAIPKHNYFMIPEYIKNKTTKYFASGLLLINTKKFIDYKIYEKCLNFLKNEKYEMPDQDALNASIDDSKWIELDLKYGIETSFLENNIPELNKKIESAKIIQFSGSSKPWHFRNKHPYKNLYWQYLRMTPYKRYIPEDLNIINIIKWIIPKSIKKFIKEIKGVVFR